MDRETSDMSSISMDLEQCRLADTARDHFSNKNYDECLKNLAKIEANKEIRKKVAHNKAVAHFYKSALKKYLEFRKSLEDIIGELPNTSVEAFDIKDLSLAVPLFNKAVIHYQLRQPLAAWKSLHILLKHLDALDTMVAQKIGLLAIQLMLNLYQPKKADAIITMLKMRLCSTADLFGGKDGDESDMNVQKAPDLSEKVKSLEQFKWMFRLYEMRSKVMNGKVVLIPPEETPEMLVLKAHQYYVGHDYQMAAKELAKKPATMLSDFLTNGEDYNTIIANNMGLIHFHVRHYALAVRFFQHALTFDQKATEAVANDLAIHYIGASKNPEILYNLGIAMLHSQRPLEAFECLLVPLNYYHNNPRLWLRLAEACIMAHKENLKTKENKNIVSSVIGSGFHRKYILRPTPAKYVSPENESFAIPNTNLEFASLCLRNALALVEHYEKDFESATGGAEGSSKWHLEKPQTNPSQPLTLSGFIKLKYAVLTAYSYVMVCLGDYMVAFEYAESLLKLPDLPDAYKLLGNLYCAESLIMLYRCHEARAYLDPKFIAGLKEDDLIQRAAPDWTLSSLSAAQSVMEYNLCVLLVIQGERDLARALLSRCVHPVVLTHLKLLTIFLELSDGNFEKCRKIIHLNIFKSAKMNRF